MKAWLVLLLACAVLAQGREFDFAGRELLGTNTTNTTGAGTATRPGPDRPGPTSGGVQKADSAAAVTGTRGTKQDCYTIARNSYCDRYSQQNCCESANPSYFFNCEIWDSNYNCPTYKPFMVCCS